MVVAYVAYGLFWYETIGSRHGDHMLTMGVATLVTCTAGLLCVYIFARKTKHVLAFSIIP